MEKNSLLNNLSEAIKQSKVVSFDVFDTLLLREHYNPSGIFQNVAEILNISDYQHKRTIAEAHARKLERFCSEDVTLKKIANQINNPEAISLELKLECDSCIRNDELYEIYQFARSLDKQIIAISDMYLPTSFIETLLSNAGYIVDKLYVSSDTKVSKGSGNLFKYVIKDLNITPNSILHIGDNRISDYQAPRKLSIQAYHYQAKRDKLNDLFNQIIIKQISSLNTVFSSLILGTFVKNTEQLEIMDYWEQFGYLYSGPILLSFINWLYSEIKNTNNKLLLFMSRDGQIMLEVFKILYPNYPAKYLYASRRMYFIASIEELNNNDLDFLTAGLSGTPAIEFITRLNLSTAIETTLISNLKSYFETTAEKITSNHQLCQLKKFFIDNQSLLKLEAKKEKAAIVNYINTLLEENKFEECAVVDVGWAANSQKYFEKTLECNIQGYYFGTNSSVYNTSATKGFMFNCGLPTKNKDSIFACVEIVELLFVGTHASINKLVNINGNCVPETNPTCEFEQYRLNIATKIQKGALKFINDIKPVLEKFNSFHAYSKEIPLILIQNLIHNPTKQDIEHIGQVPHALGLGNSTYKYLITDIKETSINKLSTFSGDVFWKKGREIWLKNNKINHTPATTLRNYFMKLYKVKYKLSRYIIFSKFSCNNIVRRLFYIIKSK